MTPRSKTLSPAEFESLAKDYAQRRIDLDTFRAALSQPEDVPVPVTRIPDSESAPVPVYPITPVSPLPISKVYPVKAPSSDAPSPATPYFFSGAINKAAENANKAKASEKDNQLVKPAVQDKNGSAKKDSVSGVASGMGASNPTGTQQPGPATSASSRFQAYGPNFSRKGEASLPAGSIGYANKDGTYTVENAAGEMQSYASEAEARGGKPSAPATVRFPSELVTSQMPTQQIVSQLSPQSQADLNEFLSNQPEFNTPAEPAEPGAPTGMGSIPAATPQKRSRPKDSGWRKRKGGF